MDKMSMVLEVELLHNAAHWLLDVLKFALGFALGGYAALRLARRDMAGEVVE